MAHLFSDPEFYVLVAVAIFFIVVWKPMRRAVVGALDSRAERIRQELDAARNLRDEAQQALAAYQRQQQEGAAEAQAIITHAKEEAERIAAQSLRDLESALSRRQQLAQERIAQEEAKAIGRDPRDRRRCRDRRFASGHRRLARRARAARR